jgi:hypothetical protein
LAQGFGSVEAAANHPHRTGTTCPAVNFLRNAWLIQF